MLLTNTQATLMRKAHILIVDDDTQICELVRDYLCQYDYQVSSAHDGRQMTKALAAHKIDLIILDIMLPGEDGISLCRKLRETSEIPIVMLSAAGDEADRVIGLEVGADDYLAKPFSSRELLARVKALLRRTQGDLGQKRKALQLTQLPDIRFGEWILDRRERKLIAPDGVAVPLSTGEYKLLLAFIENPGRNLSRDQLLDITQGKEANPFDRSIDVQVGRLRKKIETDPKNPETIVTIRGGGYRFTAKTSEVDSAA